MRRSPSQPPAIPGLRFERQLGAGGFSDVFLYEQQLPRRQVAVKVLLAEHLSEQTREAFVAEANLMAQLSAHPYIVTIYTADVAPDGRPYLAMEYCAGPSLAEQAKLRRFAVADALRTGVRLASAVATAHAAGILHRDIKPANVLTNAYGWPALTDFGISQAVELEVPTTAGPGRPGDVGSTGASGTQTVGLSIPWSPPEMFEDEPHPDVRSDVFSLAATVYTLLAGRTPFEIPGQSNGAADLISRIERGTVTPLGRDDAPASLVATLQKGLAKDRANRFESAVDFARALQRVEMELAYAPTPIDIPNLVQPQSQAPRPDTSSSASDETRVRQVPTVEAQPRPGVPSVQPSVGDETVVRSAGPLVQPIQPSAPIMVGAASLPSETIRRDRLETAAAVPTEDPDADAAGRGRRRRLTRLLVVGAVAVLAVGGIAAGIIWQGAAADPKPTAAATGAPIQLSDVPSPKPFGVNISEDGSVVTFIWDNPDPQDGDSYIYQVTSSGKNSPKVPTSTYAVDLKPSAPGAQLCIEVVIVRGGVTSPDPLEMCSQQ
ncbi:serine/threonine-protein kinase [Plantibacter cousiniae (nom. nud.)]|uniref:serine/threonine-protein kinase n=1 Tax=Plantibacter cousiniae (nom. nud.) TaxID=199709 RepID=UPI001D96CED3|nr:serine/threonine-protein kinase [Plantibacter cousiniae]CAH0213477.1 Serine/threonine-protein kinase PknK [Plantibacter cousiniae]